MMWEVAGKGGWENGRMECGDRHKLPATGSGRGMLARILWGGMKAVQVNERCRVRSCLLCYQSWAEPALEKQPLVQTATAPCSTGAEGEGLETAGHWGIARGEWKYGVE